MFRYGLQHSIEPTFINKTDIWLYPPDNEQTFKRSERYWRSKSQNFILCKYLCQFIQTNKNALRKHKTLKKLRNSNNILIRKPDKGNGVVIVDRIYYMSSMYKIFVVWKKKFSPKMFMTTYILVGPNWLGYMVIPRLLNLNLRQIS